ncbi:prepilin-type N-terminal cleavage/methylation domain-containing protein, partial [Bradyrhizobium sp. NBAIM20]|uniref:PilW family protein n=1 Tax=Bradyrhizobium sp. NBAIM20 TaxID=2793811 RepID=UPI001CD6BFB2
MYFAPRGLGLIELMVGITVGLIVAAGASLVAVNQINEHRRLMLEIQVQQDLRTAADLVQQELRRAGFRGRADLGVWSPPQGVGTLKQLEARPASVNEFMPVDTSDTRNLIRRPLLVSKSDTTGTVMT